MALGRRKSVQQPLFVTTADLNIRSHPFYEAVNKVLDAHHFDTFAEGLCVKFYDDGERGRQDWEGQPDARNAVYANRRRIKGDRGKRLLRSRGEKLERTFVHCCETGGMRRVHLRGRDNVAKRALIHAAGFNLGLLMRVRYGMRKPRSGSGIVCALVGSPIHAVRRLGAAMGTIIATGRQLAAIFRRSPAALAA